ncbi:MAG: hypothetical protein M1820_009122 [Bogoriella megaspora]|nr:MAG: hypothetical protein M1820_009122 [Bogoriella megaspora]
MSVAVVLCALASLASAAPSLKSRVALPIVDLGYQKQQASGINATGGFYNFSNIRYAAPPLGNLRFAAPQEPDQNATVNDGLDGRVCPQAIPSWTGYATQFLAQYLLTGNSTPPVLPTTNRTLPPDSRENEDCLFLDVLVPTDIFDSQTNGSKGAPVLVWIYGGGYTEGSKGGSGDASGLIARSRTGTNGVVFVELNYRLGAFGWSSGPSLQANGSANAGLLDQRFALEWVQKHISKFGGDPERVTIIGESAGGGSVMHQITAYGGLKGPVPFQQAIPQSPGFQPTTSNFQQEETLQAFLQLLNVSTIQEARQLPSSALIQANSQQISAASYGQFTYGPVVDGDFAPALPGQLLQRGQFDHSLRILSAHNTNEGLLFSSPFVQNDTASVAQLQEFFPDADPLVILYISTQLYPSVFDGSQGYTSQLQREALLVSEYVFTCNDFYLAKAFGNQTYEYVFSVPPGIHGEDIPYTFFNGIISNVPASGAQSSAVAIALQEYVTNFAETGDPNGDGLVNFPMYGPNATVQIINVNPDQSVNLTQGIDPAANSRCNWWQQAQYF